jgi:hypothetical protein
MIKFGNNLIFAQICNEEFSENTQYGGSRLARRRFFFKTAAAWSKLSAASA